MHVFGYLYNLLYYIDVNKGKEVMQLTDSNRANGSGSGDYQPSKTYEHVEGDLWVEQNEGTGEAEFIYELLEELADDEEPKTDN